MNAGKLLAASLAVFFLGMLFGTALTYLATAQNGSRLYDTYTAATDQNDFTRSVGSVLEHPVSNPRIGTALFDKPTAAVNYRNHDGFYPIVHVTVGTKLTELGRINDGRVLVCYSVTGLPVEPYCANGNAFLVDKQDEGKVFDSK